jgi:hypothetical protein
MVLIRDIIPRTVKFMEPDEYIFVFKEGINRGKDRLPAVGVWLKIDLLADEHV